MIAHGAPLPEFSLPDQAGTLCHRAEYAGRWLAVYCYPRDNTTGCSLEAAAFAALAGQFAEREAAIVGVSADSVKSHAGFAAKLALPFTLLSDEAHTFLEALGVWQKKKMAGREYMGIVRSTVLVDPAGIVRRVWTKVKPDGHAEVVLAALDELRA